MKDHNKSYIEKWKAILKKMVNFGIYWYLKVHVQHGQGRLKLQCTWLRHVWDRTLLFNNNNNNNNNTTILHVVVILILIAIA